MRIFEDRVLASDIRGLERAISNLSDENMSLSRKLRSNSARVTRLERILRQLMRPIDDPLDAAARIDKDDEEVEDESPSQDEMRARLRGSFSSQA